MQGARTRKPDKSDQGRKVTTTCQEDAVILRAWYCACLFSFQELIHTLEDGLLQLPGMPSAHCQKLCWAKAPFKCWQLSFCYLCLCLWRGFSFWLCKSCWKYSYSNQLCTFNHLFLKPLSCASCYAINFHPMKVSSGAADFLLLQLI